MKNGVGWKKPSSDRKENVINTESALHKMSSHFSSISCVYFGIKESIFLMLWAKQLEIMDSLALSVANPELKANSHIIKKWKEWRAMTIYFLKGYGNFKKYIKIVNCWEKLGDAFFLSYVLRLFQMLEIMALCNFLYPVSRSNPFTNYCSFCPLFCHPFPQLHVKSTPREC